MPNISDLRARYSQWHARRANWTATGRELNRSIRRADRNTRRATRAAELTRAGRAGQGGALGALVNAAEWAVAVLIAAATATSAAESYHGLLDWALSHGFTGPAAWAFPLMVDVFVVVGELCTFISLARRWSGLSRFGSWLLTFVGLAVSVAGNVAHLPAGVPLSWHAGAAVPPIAAATALAVGLGVLKRRVAAAAAPAAGQPAGTPGSGLGQWLDPGQHAEPFPPGDTGSTVRHWHEPAGSPVGAPVWPDGSGWAEVPPVSAPAGAPVPPKVARAMDQATRRPARPVEDNSPEFTAALDHLFTVARAGLPLPAARVLARSHFATEGSPNGNRRAAARALDAHHLAETARSMETRAHE